LIDDTEFHELIGELDPRFKIPHSKKLGIENENLKKKISSSLQNARIISVCADIWSRPRETLLA